MMKYMVIFILVTLVVQKNALKYEPVIKNVPAVRSVPNFKSFEAKRSASSSLGDFSNKDNSTFEITLEM